MYIQSLNIVEINGVRYLNNPETALPWANKEEADLWIQKQTKPIVFEKNEEPLLVPVTNVQITGNTLNYANPMYWVKVNNEVVISADVNLPNGTYMAIFSRLVDGKLADDDIYQPFDILNGKLELKITFTKNGNYVLNPERLSRGLNRMGKNVKLQFDIVDFISYGN